MVDPQIEQYAVAHTTAPRDEVAVLRAEVATATAARMAGGLVEVKLLEAIVIASQARRVLEIGTFMGVSALSIAALLPEDGEIVRRPDRLPSGAQVLSKAAVARGPLPPRGRIAVECPVSLGLLARDRGLPRASLNRPS